MSKIFWTSVTEEINATIDVREGTSENLREKFVLS